MKHFLFLALITVLSISFSSCSKESEDVEHEVDLVLVYGSYIGTYTNISGDISNLITTTTNNYQVEITGDISSNLISIEGRLDNEISLVTADLKTSDGITYYANSGHPDLRSFSFNVNTNEMELDLYQNDESKEYKGRQQ